MDKKIKIVSVLLMVLLMFVSASAEEGTLKQGDKGKDVIKLQERLKELVYFDGEETGVYDKATTNSVKEFQKDAGLVQSGKADEETQNKLLAKKR